MTLITATNLNDQVDYLGTNGQSFAGETLNSTSHVSPRNAIIEDDDDDDLDTTLPDPDDDDDDLIDDDDDTYVDADELDRIDDNDDADIISDDDGNGSTTSGMNSASFADRPQGRTTGRMIDHEPGSGSPSNL